MSKGLLKGDLINNAYSQLRISGLTVEPGPEELEIALERMEDMAHEWFARNICAGYQFEDEPHPNTPHNVDRGHRHAFSTNLAIRLVPDFNKEAHQVLYAQASSSLSTLSNVSARNLLDQVQYPRRQPIGEANSLRWSRWLRWYRPAGKAPQTCETVRMQIDEIDDFTESFADYLQTGEDVSSYVLEATDGLSVNAESLATPIVSYTIQAVGGSDEQSTVDAVQITATTSNGRVEIRTIYFEVST